LGSETSVNLNKLHGLKETAVLKESEVEEFFRPGGPKYFESRQI
jgi:hypothetical protein